MFDLSGKYEAVHQKVHADEIHIIMFFTRDIVIFCHRGEDMGGEEAGGNLRRVHISGSS